MSCCAPQSQSSSSCCKQTEAKESSSCCAPQSQSSSSCCKKTVATKESSSCCTPQSQSSSCSKQSAKSCCTKVVGNDDIKSQVRSTYGQVATTPATNADEVAMKFGYSKEELETLPEWSNLGLSCGNPLAHASIKEGEVVVDLGSGGGLDCFLASQKVGSSGKVYGVDMTPEMIALAKSNAAKRNITNVDFLQGEIESLPLPDNVADVVISNCVINLVPSKPKAFAEIFRILKPGGRLAISDIVLKKEFPEDLKSNVQLICACIAAAMLLSEVPQILQNAGFTGVLVTTSNFDLNVYKSLGSGGGGCCGSVDDLSPLTSGVPQDFDFNEYATSAKIFAVK